MAQPSFPQTEYEGNEFDYTVCIRLTKGQHALIDAEDYEKVIHRKWQYNRRGYAVYSVYVPVKKRKTVLMHRWLMDAPTDRQVDHVNGNKLDNRKVNLRHCSGKENSRNRRAQRKHAPGASSYKGITYHIHRRQWQAKISVDKKYIYLGLHATPEEAAEAYNQAALHYFGAFARLNDVSPARPTSSAPPSR